jgi:hypothetical protein
MCSQLLFEVINGWPMIFISQLSVLGLRICYILYDFTVTVLFLIFLKGLLSEIFVCFTWPIIMICADVHPAFDYYYKMLYYLTFKLHNRCTDDLTCVC